MNRLPRISGNVMIRYLIEKGFVITRRKGSHASLQKDTRYTTIPAGNDRLKPGLILGILRDVGISRNEFVNDYERGLVN